MDTFSSHSATQSKMNTMQCSNMKGETQDKEIKMTTRSKTTTMTLNVILILCIMQSKMEILAVIVQFKLTSIHIWKGLNYVYKDHNIYHNSMIMMLIVKPFFAVASDMLLVSQLEESGK